MIKILVQATFWAAGTWIGLVIGMAVAEEIEPEVRRATRWSIRKLGGDSVPAEVQMRAVA